MLNRAPMRLLTRSCQIALVILASSVSVSDTVTGQRTDTVVKLASAPRHPGVATLVPELKIGMVDGPPEYLFGGPSTILLQRDGAIVVIDYAGDMGAAIIRRYDANGKFLRNIGGAGDGPGEYRGPTGLAELPDGRLVMGDPRLARLTTYSATGDMITTWNVVGYSYPVRGTDQVKAGPDGTVYLRFSNRADRNAPAQIGIARFRTDGTIRDTLRPPDLPDFNAPRLTATHASGRGSYSTTVPYWPRGLWTLSPQGYFITAVSNRYAIDINQGNRVISIRRNVAPVSVSARERDEQRDYVRDWLRFYATFNGTVPEVPSTKPYIKFITTFEDGRIWASLSTPSDRYDPPPRIVGGRPLPPQRWREPNLFDVFEPDGTYVGQVAVPDGISLRTVRGDVAWGSTRGEEDVPYVVRYRIAWRR